MNMKQKNFLLPISLMILVVEGSRICTFRVGSHLFLEYLMRSRGFRVLERLPIEVAFLFRDPSHSHKTVQYIIEEL